MLIKRHRLKEGGVYCRVKGIIYSKFQGSVSFSLQKTINNHHYDIRTEADTGFQQS